MRSKFQNTFIGIFGVGKQTRSLPSDVLPHSELNVRTSMCQDDVLAQHWEKEKMMQIGLCWSQKSVTTHLSKMTAHLEHLTGSFRVCFWNHLSISLRSYSFSFLASTVVILFFFFFCKKPQYKTKVISLPLFSNCWIFMFSGSCAAGMVTLLLCKHGK